jgi:hypothetical protein
MQRMVAAEKLAKARKYARRGEMAAGVKSENGGEHGVATVAKEAALAAANGSGISWRTHGNNGSAMARALAHFFFFFFWTVA